jgi:hypothetical protein
MMNGNMSHGPMMNGNMNNMGNNMNMNSDSMYHGMSSENYC